MDKNKEKCCQCNNIFPNVTGCGTGYGLDGNGNKICYSCCADLERKDMISTGRGVLYLKKIALSNEYEIINWPGTLRFRVGRINKGRHNIARIQRTGRFVGPDGKQWAFRQYGNWSEIAHCRRLKE